MSLVQRILRAPEQRGLTATEAVRRTLQSVVTRSGVAVNEQNAMQLMAVFTAVRILAEGFAQVPLKVYRRRPDGSRDEARDHPLYKILHDQPNDEMTSFQLRETMAAHVALWGNSYCEISRNGLCEVIGLWPLLPNRTLPRRLPSGALVYVTQIQKDPSNTQQVQETILPARNVLHVPGLSLNGMKGLSVIGTVREGIGLAFSYEAFGAYFFGNNTVPGLTLATDLPLKKEHVDEIERRIREGHEGLTNSQRLMILTNGLKPVNVGMPLDDAQFLEQRKYTRSEIMGLYRIAPHLSNDTEKVSSWGAGIEQMSIGHIVYTMAPYYKRFEQVLNMKLFGANAQAPLYPEFDPEGFLRGDYKTRMEGYAIARQWGWMSVNDIRHKENEMIIGAQGDIYLTPSNMVPSDRLGDIVDKQVEPAPAPVAAIGGRFLTRPIGPYEDWDACVLAQLEKGHDKESAEKICGAMENDSARSFRHVLTDTTERILRREQNDISAGVKRLLKKGSLADIPPWLEEFYAEHRTWVAKQATPVFAGIADAMGVRDGQRVRAIVGAYVERLCAESMDGLRRAIRGEDELERVLGAVDRSAAGIAEREIDLAIEALQPGKERDDVDYAKLEKMFGANTEQILEKVRGMIPPAQPQQPQVIFEPGAIQVQAAPTPNVTVQPQITLQPQEVKVHFPKDAIRVESNITVEAPDEEVDFERDKQGTITGMKRKKKK